MMISVSKLHWTRAHLICVRHYVWWSRQELLGIDVDRDGGWSCLQFLNHKSINFWHKDPWSSLYGRQSIQALAIMTIHSDFHNFSQNTESLYWLKRDSSDRAFGSDINLLVSHTILLSCQCLFSIIHVGAREGCSWAKTTNHGSRITAGQANSSSWS